MSTIKEGVSQLRIRLIEKGYTEDEANEKIADLLLNLSLRLATSEKGICLLAQPYVVVGQMPPGEVMKDVISHLETKVSV